jgi:hypothetical protein
VPAPVTGALAGLCTNSAGSARAQTHKRKWAQSRQDGAQRCLTGALVPPGPGRVVPYSVELKVGRTMPAVPQQSPPLPLSGVAVIHVVFGHGQREAASASGMLPPARAAATSRRRRHRRLLQVSYGRGGGGSAGREGKRQRAHKRADGLIAPLATRRRAPSARWSA